MVASTANELFSASHSVKLLLLADMVLVLGWPGVAVHNNPLCFTLHLVQARSVHFSGEQLRLRQLRHTPHPLTRSRLSATDSERN